jgi:hypothetical protein
MIVIRVSRARVRERERGSEREREREREMAVLNIFFNSFKNINLKHTEGQSK